MNMNARDALEKKRLKFAKVGIIIGLGAGVAYGFQGIVLGEAGTLSPFADPSYGLWLICVASLVTSGLHEIFAGVWALVFNQARGTGLREYGRLLKTKMGWMLMGGALVGGPLAASAYLIAINLCGPTYAAAITAFFPVIGQVLSSIFFKEKIKGRAWMGILLVVIGSLVVGFAPPEGVYPHFYVGIIFAVISAVLWAVEGIIVTYANDIVDAYVPVGVFRSFGAGIMDLLILVPLCGAIGGVGLSGFGMIADAFAAGWPVILVAIAAIGGAFNYLAFYSAMSMTGVGRAMALDVTYGVWSILFGFAFQALGLIEYSITTMAVIGVIVIVAGTILVIANPKELLQLRGGVQDVAV
ncbi:MAG: DMT family transporter [Firmicutes bacterium]|nr:DMT family transporter [Bacillota bacterium]